LDYKTVAVSGQMKVDSWGWLMADTLASLLEYQLVQQLVVVMVLMLVDWKGYLSAVEMVACLEKRKEYQ
jgi:hypothetical protein